MRNGFSLIELVVVLMIMAIVAGAVAPAMVRSTRERAPGEDIVNLLREARRLAARTGLPVQVTVRGQSFSLAVSAGQPRKGRLQIVTQDTADFSFEPTGMATGDSLRFIDAGKSRVAVLDAWTGDVEIR